MALNPGILSPQELESRLIDWAGRTQSYPFLLNQSDSESAISAKKLEDWFSGIEACGGACDISPLQWADVAIFFLSPEEARDGELKAVMKERRARYLEETKQSLWDWNDFKEDLRLLNRTWSLQTASYIFIYLFLLS